MFARAAHGGAPPEFGVVGPPSWSDRPVFLVGGGASLRGFDFGCLAGLGYCVGVNQAMFNVVDCDAAISIDHLFVRAHAQALEWFARDRELYLAVGNLWWHVLDEVPGAIYLRLGSPPLSDWPGAVATLGTSGGAALNLAVLKGARRIVLLGYDYGLIDGRHHYHDAYPWHHRANDQSWPAWAKNFDALAPILAARGIEVINASPPSAIRCFPKMSIADALAAAVQR